MRGHEGSVGAIWCPACVRGVSEIRGARLGIGPIDVANQEVTRMPTELHLVAGHVESVSPVEIAEVIEHLAARIRRDANADLYAPWAVATLAARRDVTVAISSSPRRWSGSLVRAGRTPSASPSASIPARSPRCCAPRRR